MAKATSNVTLIVNLELTEYEARWIRGVAQNCLGDKVTEPPAESFARESIFLALDKALDSSPRG
jgi:hypothetical protein